MIKKIFSYVPEVLIFGSTIALLAGVLEFRIAIALMLSGFFLSIFIEPSGR